MDITPAVVTAFRADFEQFASSQSWPDAKITRALQRADKETGSGRWGGYSDLSFKQRGMFMFAAHSLVADKRQAASLKSVQAKSVGDESVTYANGPGDQLLVGDDALNATAYGKEFLRLRRRAAAGASSSMAAVVG